MKDAQRTGGKGEPVMVLGLTGGMACGKSAAGEAFCAEGFGSLDADDLVREILRSDSRVKRALEDRFGSAVLTSGGEVDRAAVASIVFSSTEELTWLEALLHPEVERLLLARIAAEPRRNQVVQVPLLFEIGMEGRFDATVCVAAAPGVRRERIRARGLSEEEATARESRQFPLEKKMELADYVIVNDGSPRFLREEVRELLRILGVGGKP